MLIFEADKSYEIALALVQQHGQDAGQYAVARVRLLLEIGDEAELAVWLKAMAEVVSLLAEQE